MNGCREIELELVAYCSGELDPAEKGMIRNHLDGCASCRAELDREMELRRILGSLPKENIPDVLDSRIMAAANPSVATLPAGRSRKRLTAGLALAAASLAIALLVPTLRPGSEPEQAWTQEEIATARQEVMYTLALTAKVIDRTQKDAVVNVFADKLPRAINESFKMVKPTTSGGKG